MRDEAAQPLETMGPAPVRTAVQHQRVQAGVAGEHFPGGTGGRVALKNALNVGAEAGKHKPSLPVVGRKRFSARFACGIRAPTLVSACTSLSPEGAGLAWGGPTLRRARGLLRHCPGNATQ